MPLESTPESPLPVRSVARAIGEWVGRLGRVWVEGQVTELGRRSGPGPVFLTLRDPVAEVSVRMRCPRPVCDAVDPPLTEGARVVVWAKPEYGVQRGSLLLAAEEIRPVGVGALLARIEQLRKMLAAEGLFAVERKRALPFLPGIVGLVTGRASAAERDVVDNARRRWPAVRFRIENAAVQGPYAVTELLDALRRLDSDPSVDVIVLARGGGSLEDFLPFSDEALVRAIAGCGTPIVTAIGHETDSPLADHAADRRASTPTDAAKLVVPDVGEESARVRALRDRGRRCVEARLEQEHKALAGLRSRPVLADPFRTLGQRGEQVDGLLDRARRAMRVQLDRAGDDLGHMAARVTALSPAATLERGYAVLQQSDGRVVRGPDQVRPGEALSARLARGRLRLQVPDDS